MGEAGETDAKAVLSTPPPTDPFDAQSGEDCEEGLPST
jgi:hypothetical protein